MTEQELQQFAGERVAGFKVPRHLAVVDEIPMGPTGKLQRIGLAVRLGLGETKPSAPFAEPRTELERELARLWGEILASSASGPTTTSSPSAATRSSPWS